MAKKTIEKELQKQFEAFHANIKLDFDDNAKLRAKRDLLIDELRTWLKEHAKKIGITTPTFSFFNQGSYAVGLGIKPLPGGDYDIDVALVFNFDKTQITPFELKQCLESAFHRHNRTVIQKNPCVTVQYHKDGEEIYHVDFASFTNPDCEPDDNHYLARGKNKSTEVWEMGNPDELIEIIKTAFSGEAAQHFKRVIKAFKRWKDFNFDSGNGRPVGIALTACALKWFESVESESENVRFYNDCRALKALVQKMLDNFILQWDGDKGVCVERLSVQLPVPPGNDLFKKMSHTSMANFQTRLTRLKNTLEKALAADSIRAACILLEKEFGADFPIPAEIPAEYEAKAVNNAFVKGHLTITTPSTTQVLPVKNKGGFYGT